MSLDEFRQLHARKVTEKPKLFELELPSPPATEEQMGSVEEDIGIQFPPVFRAFLSEFGGGSFGLVDVFVPEEGIHSIKNNNNVESIPENYLAFSDDHCGGWYLFPHSNGRAEDQVFYWNSDGGLIKTEFSNILDFLSKCAYG